MTRHRVVIATVAAALSLTGCGEPAVDVTIPPRAGHVADMAGILDVPALEDRLQDLEQQGLDIVVLTYQTDQANCGEAFRAGGELVADWEADIALVAVARLGDFQSRADDRERCLGLRPLDDFAVGRGLREQIAEEVWPPLLQDNEWDGAIEAAIEVLAADRRGADQ